MKNSNNILTQFLKLLPQKEFSEIVKKYDGDKYVKTFFTLDHIKVLIYAQLMSKKSLRDIETSLLAQRKVNKEISIAPVTRSNLSEANEGRNYRIIEGLFYLLLAIVKEKSPSHHFRFKNPLYTMDSTTINVCLKTYSWALAAKGKGAVKIHTLFNNSGYLPEFFVLTNGLGADLAVARENIALKKGSILVMDKAYQDFDWFYKLDKSGVFFVIRSKFSCYEVIEENTFAKNRGILSDQTIILTQRESKKKYPKELRLIKYLDKETNKEYTFVTNNFNLSARTIADIYKERWQIELFFKWIKQDLKIKKFFGTSENAVMLQVWSVFLTYLLIQYVSFLSKNKLKALEILRILRECLFIDIDIWDLLSLRPEVPKEKKRYSQLKLALNLTGH